MRDLGLEPSAGPGKLPSGRELFANGGNLRIQVANPRAGNPASLRFKRTQFRFERRLLLIERVTRREKSFVRIIQPVSAIDAGKHRLQTVIILLRDRIEL